MRRLHLFLSIFLLASLSIQAQEAPQKEVISLLDWRGGEGYQRTPASLSVNQKFIQKICQDVEQDKLTVFSDSDLSEEIDKKELIDIVFNQYFHGPCGGSEKHSAEEFTVDEAFKTLESHFYTNISLGLWETWTLGDGPWKADQKAAFLEVADPNFQMDSRFVWIKPQDLLPYVKELSLQRSYAAEARHNAQVHYALKTADFKIVAWRPLGSDTWKGNQTWRKRMRYEFGPSVSDSLIKAWSTKPGDPFATLGRSLEKGLRDPYVITIPYALKPFQYLPGVAPQDTSMLQVNRDLFAEVFLPAYEAVKAGSLKAYKPDLGGGKKELEKVPDLSGQELTLRVIVEGKLSNDSRGLRYFPQWISFMGHPKGNLMGETLYFAVRLGELPEPENLLNRILQRDYYYFPVHINDQPIGSVKKALFLRHYMEGGLWDEVPDEISLQEMEEDILMERLKIWYRTGE